MVMSAAVVARCAPPLLFSLLILLAAASTSQGAGFGCRSVTAQCQALAGYVTDNETTYEAIRTLFQVDSVLALYGANNLDASTPASTKVPAGNTVRVPFPCACANGTGTSAGRRPVYTVKKGDSLYNIATHIYKGFITNEQIAAVNTLYNIAVGVHNGSNTYQQIVPAKNDSMIEIGQQLWIPLPCSCDPVDGLETAHLAHLVARRSTLAGIADQFGTTVETLRRINNISDPEGLRAGQALDVPLKACSSSIRRDALDYSLRLPNGSYALTAASCVKCSCSSSWQLACEMVEDLNLTRSSACRAATCSGGNSPGRTIPLGRTVFDACGSTRCDYAGYDDSAIFTTSVTNQSACGNKPPIGKRLLITIIVVGVITGLAFVTCIIIWRSKASKKTPYMEKIPCIRSLLFDLSTLKIATDNFSNSNKLGEGGFGAVYKGILPGGQAAAVKRLSASSRQGLEELRNEVELLAKQEHRNLVRLLGVCLEEEKLLVYEYMPNRSLDNFLFDPTKTKQLTWQLRNKIIGGVARGLLYLHEESQYTIIHRDLKASNILLDANMNPKIADFGISRLFCGDQTHLSTSRVVGTFGYMAPEYVINGQFSKKSDVFSFGVLVLEIVTGRRNSSFSYSEGSVNLLSYVWENWKVGAAQEIIDPSLGDRYQQIEAFKCIQIGLLCVQPAAVDRPTMSTIVLMLDSLPMTIDVPLQPAFFPRQFEIDRVPNVEPSLNELSITKLDPR